MHNQVVSRDEWLNARIELLRTEKELTSAQRRGGASAPGAAVGPSRQDYRFDTDEGSADAQGPLPRALAAPRLSLHVRA